MRAILVILLSLCCTLAAGSEPDTGFPVNLAPWEIDTPAHIVSGVLTSDSQGGRYVAELRSSQPAPRKLPYFLPIEGRTGTFASEGSRCTLSSPGVVDFHQQGQGYCGLMITLASPRDARGKELFAWVRGSGKVHLRAADPAWQERQDSVLLQSHSLARAWTRIRVPVEHPRLDASALASVIFQAEGDGRLEFAGLCLVEPGAPGPAAPRASAGARPAGTAVWVWDTDKRLASSDLTWLDFLQGQEVSTVFLHLPREFGPKLAHLVGTMRARGMEVQALQGDRHDVLPEGRALALARLERLLAWQDTLPAEQRFQGLHLDVEPYLLPGFSGARQPDLLRAYLFLVEEVGARAHRHGLPAGFDIPCWYDHLPTLSVAGLDQSPLDHILDRADEIAVMSYRTTASRVLESSRSEREGAARRQKRLWMGLETESLPDETSVRFEGVPREGLAGRDEVVLVGGRFHLGPHPVAGLVWPVKAREDSPARNLSFAGTSSARLLQVRRELQEQSAGAAQAVHHLGSWQRLVGP